MDTNEVKGRMDKKMKGTVRKPDENQPPRRD
jgi:hypothetical protein